MFGAKLASMVLCKMRPRPPNSVNDAVQPARPQVVLAGMRTGSSLLISRMDGARKFHRDAQSRSSAHELLHPRLLAGLVRNLAMPAEVLRERGPLAVFERIWSEFGPCPIKIMPGHFLRACWRFGCAEEPGLMFARWVREVPADLILLRRRDLMAQVASGLRAEVAHDFDRGARQADAPLAWTSKTSEITARVAARIGFDDTVIFALHGIKVFYETLCASGFEHDALKGTELNPLPANRDFADIDRTIATADRERFRSRARAGLARGRLRAWREILPYVRAVNQLK